MQRPGPASPTPRRSEGAGTGSCMSVLVSAPRGAAGGGTPGAGPGRPQVPGAPVVSATAWGRRKPARPRQARGARVGGPGSPRSSATLRFPQRRCPRRPGWDVTPPPASRGALHGGVRAGRPSSQVGISAPGPRRAREAQPGRCLPLGARSFARGSATGQRPPEARRPCPRTGSRGSTAARRA